MSEPDAEPLIWYHRIGFRLGVGLAAMLLLAYVLFPYVHDFSLRLFGLPGIDKNLVRWSAENPPTDALEEIGRARLLPREDMIFVTHYLLEGAVHEAPGRWRPEPHRIVTLDRVLAADGQSYAWLDADRRVLFASPGLPVAEGDTLDVSLAEEGSSLGQTHDGVALGRLATGVWKEGEFAGWVLVYPRPPGPRLELLVSESDEGGPIVVGDDVLLPGGQFESTVRWSDRVLNAASILSFGGLALLLSLAVSRMITRRVTSLANLAAKPVNDPRDLPGPFDESGHDEIATLARTMNGMRARVLKLVEDLDRRDRDRRLWIAQVSHDLRTPLTALIACLERAEATLDSEGPEAVRERLTVARMDAARLNVLTEDLLDIARLETEEAPVREPVPPGELVRQAARAMSGLAELHGVELEPEVEPELPLLNADGRRLMRGLENLLRNALHHAKSRVTVSARKGSGGVVFEVRDDGAGLPVENDGSVDIEGLATNLSRDDSSGLGLVVVRKVAEAHGGSMGARNCEGGGALVWFAVPA